MFDIGETRIVEDTDLNRKNGLIAGKRTKIRFVDSGHITLYFEQVGQVDLKVPRDHFGTNFPPFNALVPLDMAIGTTEHATTPYVTRWPAP